MFAGGFYSPAGAGFFEEVRRLRQKCKTLNKMLVFIPSLTVGAWNLDF